MIKKYLVTFRNTFLSLVINFISFSILPKSVSLSDYGLYQFATTFFSSLRSLLDLSVISGVFQLTAKYRNSQQILNLYSIFLLFQLAMILVIMICINLLNLTYQIFDTNNIYLILFIGVVEFINFIFVFLLSYGDAKCLTIEFQKIKTYELTIRVISLITIYFLGLLTLNSFLTITFVIALTANIILLKKLNFIKKFSIQKQKLILYSKKIMNYSLPLAIVEIVAVFYNIADIFLIQSMLGVKIFAVYIYAYKFIMVILVFIQPMFNILWQYVAENFIKDIYKIQVIFSKLLIIIYTLSVMFMLFLFNFSKNIILLFADDRYIKSADYLSILSIMVIPLAIEKLAVVILYATHSTKEYRNIVITGTLFSIFASLLIYMLYKFNIISIDYLIWIIIIKIVIYSYILNGFILRSAINILKINYISIIKNILIISSILFILNIHLYLFSFNVLTKFILFSIVNLMIISFMLISFKNIINNLEVGNVTKK